MGSLISKSTSNMPKSFNLFDMTLSDDILFSPMYSIKPEIIDDTKVIDIDNYEDKQHILDKIKSDAPEHLVVMKRVLNTKQFNEPSLHQLKDIHFTNKFCESLIHLHNKSGTYNEKNYSIVIVQNSTQEIMDRIRNKE